MDTEQLQAWLIEHADDISRFTDYEIAISPDDVLSANLGLYWFRDHKWNERGYQFISLGQDGTGGVLALWRSPSRPDSAPVVFFGSEGGAGVIAESPLAFALALAYGPVLEEYEEGDLDAPSRLSVEANWFLSSDDPEEEAAAKDALARYRRCAEERLGPIPPLASLVTIPRGVQHEFRDWVTTTQSRVAERDAAEKQLAAARRRQEARDKASRYAALAKELPANAATLIKDGYQFRGVCAACGAATTIRLTIFEEFTFGLCALATFPMLGEFSPMRDRSGARMRWRDEPWGGSR